MSTIHETTQQCAADWEVHRAELARMASRQAQSSQRAAREAALPRPEARFNPVAKAPTAPPSSRAHGWAHAASPAPDGTRRSSDVSQPPQHQLATRSLGRSAAPVRESAGPEPVAPQSAKPLNASGGTMSQLAESFVSTAASSNPYAAYAAMRMAGGDTDQGWGGPSGAAELRKRREVDAESAIESQPASFTPMPAPRAVASSNGAMPAATIPDTVLQQIRAVAAVRQREGGATELSIMLHAGALAGMGVRVTSYGQSRVGVRLSGRAASQADLTSLVDTLKRNGLDVVDAAMSAG